MSTSTAGGSTPRVPLTRERVLHAAVALADESGIESLSMRKLGEAVGVEAMSLYNHVANKDDLLDGMIDLVFGEIDLPSDGTDWKAAMRRRAVSARRRPGPPPLGDRADGVAELARPGHAAPPRRRARLPPAAPASRSSWPRTPSRCSTATSTGSPCRSASLPFDTPRGDRRAGAGDPGRRPRRRLPAPRRADRRARPPARLRLRQRVRVRARPHPRRPRAGQRRGCRATDAAEAGRRPVVVMRRRRPAAGGPTGRRRPSDHGFVRSTCVLGADGAAGASRPGRSAAAPSPIRPMTAQRHHRRAVRARW